MRHELKDLFAEFGPLLMFDATSRARWAAKTFDAWVLDESYFEEAEAGWCTWLACDGVREFSGTVEVLVDEAPPSHVQYAVQTARELWLRLPSGKLRFDGVTTVLDAKDAEAPTESRVLELPPGDYSVDVWAYVPHELRLESTPLPGETPRSLASTVMNVLRFVMLFVTLFGVFFAVAAYKTSSLGWFAVDVAVVIGGWLFIELLSRVSGATANERQRADEFARAVAALPPIPSFTLSLRRVEVPPAKGGGATDSFVPPSV
ncbi:MAG: hypothetical protein QM817_38850 [Archangium sp.]